MARWERGLWKDVPGPARAQLRDLFAKLRKQYGPFGRAGLGRRWAKLVAEAWFTADAASVAAVLAVVKRQNGKGRRPNVRQVNQALKRQGPASARSIRCSGGFRISSAAGGARPQTSYSTASIEACDAKRIRATIATMKGVDQLLEPMQSEALQTAIKTAKSLATKITKDVEKKGLEIAKVVQTLDLSPIDAAMVMFVETAPVAPVAASPPAVEGAEVETAEPSKGQTMQATAAVLFGGATAEEATAKLQAQAGGAA